MPVERANGGLWGLEFSCGADGGGSCATNNGNRMGETIGPLGAAQTFGYDGLNRLTAAGEAGSWSEGYGYDGFGNRWVSGVSGIGLSPLTPVAQSNYDAGTKGLVTTSFG